MQLILTIARKRPLQTSFPLCFCVPLTPKNRHYHKIAPYFDKSGFNWQVTPSNHNSLEFKALYKESKALLESENLLFSFADNTAYTATHTATHTALNSQPTPKATHSPAHSSTHSENSATQVLQNAKNSRPTTHTALTSSPTANSAKATPTALNSATKATTHSENSAKIQNPTAKATHSTAQAIKNAENSVAKATHSLTNSTTNSSPTTTRLQNLAQNAKNSQPTPKATHTALNSSPTANSAKATPKALNLKPNPALKAFEALEIFENSQNATPHCEQGKALRSNPQNLKWGEFKLGALFDIVGTKSLDENKIKFLDEGVNFIGRVNEKQRH
ncbi:hypothetical protein [Campylobacter troglodytis]|uniref:hypothetical protein n=1 Tax=Campylobacter troglodytis TaxID=654363 RepID=UPI00115B4905|nr:hypothetical protein [Campylobacter troglodytis]TQR61186.1 hypothetical protein DMC01_02650 [Campylobacter troglodytis]